MEKSLEDLLKDQLRAFVKQDYSIDGELDLYWESVFPDIDILIDNVIWLTWRRRDLTQELNDLAHQSALIREQPDLSNAEDATLLTNYWGRFAVLCCVYGQSWFERLVDKSHPITIGPLPLLDWAIPAWEHAIFMERCRHEIVHRIKQSAWNVESFRYITLDRQDAALNIQKMTSKLAKDLMPNGSDWENTASNAFVKWWEKDVPKLQEEPFHIQIQKLGITKTAIKRNIIDERRKKKQQPEEISLDVVEKEHIPTLKIPFPSSQPEETVEPLTDWQISQLNEIFGEIGCKIFVYVWDNPYLVDEDSRLIHGVKKKIAKAVGCDASTVGEYLGTTNKVGKFQLHRKEIHEIM